MLNVAQKSCEFLLSFSQFALRLNLELGIESNHQFSAFMKNVLNLVNHKFMAKLLTVRTYSIIKSLRVSSTLSSRKG